MRRFVLAAFAMLLTSIVASAQGAPQPNAIASLEVKGVPACLAWSPEQDYVYVQGIEKGVRKHYVIDIDTHRVTEVEAEPLWAVEYWQWKSSRDVPGRPDLLIQVESEKQTHRMPTVSLAQKATATQSPGANMAAMQELSNDSKNAAEIRRLKLGKETIGEFIDAPLVPGETFGWSPRELHSVAYVEHAGGPLAELNVLTGAKRALTSKGGASYPAWSPDGTRIAYLEKSGRERYLLAVVELK